jgi:hypothetical protein
VKDVDSQDYAVLEMQFIHFHVNLNPSLWLKHVFPSLGKKQKSFDVYFLR